MSPNRLLLVAYQCGPGMGSVSQIGWEWYSRLCRDHAVTLVTHVRNRAALTAAGTPLEKSEIIYIDTEWFAGPIYRLAKHLFPQSEHGVLLLSSLDYFVFDFAAYRQLRRGIDSRAHWSMLHRVTPVTLAAPTWLGRLGLPTVVGPLNSGLDDPRGFDAILQQESTGLSKARVFGRLIDTVIGSTRRITRMLIASRTTLHAVAPSQRHRCRMMIENGVDLTRFVASPWPPAPDATQPLKVLFTGRLVPIKGLDMLLHAIARLQGKDIPVELDVVGDGPMRAPWQALAGQLGLADKARFHGAQPLDAVSQRMRACHVFCLPSVRESGGAVLLEAMASARPVIALDFGGPGEIVTGDVGALLPMTHPAQVIDDLASTLADILRDPEVWCQRGLAGRHEVEVHYSWPAKIAAAEDIYRELLAARGIPCH